MKNGIEPPKRRIHHFRQKLASIHEVSRTNLRSSPEAPFNIAGIKKTLVETGIGELPDAYMNLLYVMFAFLDAEK